MSEFIIRDAEATSHVNEHGTTVTIDRTETFDTRTEGGEFVLRWFTLQHGFDGRGERKADEYAAEVELLRIDREAALWLLKELDTYLMFGMTGVQHMSTAVTKVCPRCKGEGELFTMSSMSGPCPDCNGSGVTP